MNRKTQEKYLTLKEKTSQSITKDYIDEFIKDPTSNIFQALVGLLRSSESPQQIVINGVASMGAVIRGFINLEGVLTFMREVHKYQDEAKVYSYHDDAISRDSISEILESLDKEIPDEERIQMLKTIFWAAVDISTNDKERRSAYEMLKLAKNLTSMDVLVLKHCYSKTKGEMVKDLLVDAWWNDILNTIGVSMYGPLLKSEKRLESLYILHTKSPSQRAYNIDDSSRYRLTHTGIALCEYIEKYKEFGK